MNYWFTLNTWGKDGLISKDVSDKIEKSNNSPAGSRKVIAICSIRFYKDFFTEVTWNSSLYNQQP